jgi:hypothetical protein
MSAVTDTLATVAGIVADAVPAGSGWQVHPVVPNTPNPPCVVCRPGGGQIYTVGGTYLLDVDLVCIAGKSDQPAALETVTTMVETVINALHTDLKHLPGYAPAHWDAPGQTVVGGQAYLACVATITVPILDPPTKE